ncbi:MAG: hypothetical protein WAM70_21300 [Pyrinomonadaceae bacterium]
MISIRMRVVVCLAVLCAAAIFMVPAAVCQESTQPARATRPTTDVTNFDTHLYLILGTNREMPEGKTPAILDPIVKTLRESMAFKNYTLAATFLNRVTNNERLEVSWVGGPFLLPVSTAIGHPSFNQFGATVRLIKDDRGNELVRMSVFRFGSKVPIVTAQSSITNASTSSSTFPVVNYETVGLLTDISMREGSPVIAGTLNLGPSGDAIVVVISAKRSAN